MSLKTISDKLVKSKQTITFWIGYNKSILFLFLITLLPLYSFSQNYSIPNEGLTLNLEASNFLSIQKWMDVSSNGNHGIPYNKSQQININSGITESINFNGSSDFISIKNSPSLNPSQGLTIITWFKLNDFVSNQNFISKGYTSIELPYVQYSLKMSDKSPYNTPEFNLSLNGKIVQLKATTSLSKNIWYMVACTYDRKIMKLFVNNIQDPVVKSQTDEISSYPTNLEIGRWPTGQSQYLNGDLSKIYIYNRPLSNLELENIWNFTKPTFGYQEDFNSKIQFKIDSQIIESSINNNLSSQREIENKLAQQMLIEPSKGKGQSKLKLPDGSIYEGEYTYYYKDNGSIDSSTIKRNGNGKQYDSYGVLKMEGVYVNNYLSNGKLLNNGSVEFEGNFKWDESSKKYILDGGYGKDYLYGTYLWAEGFYKNGKINGKGKMYYSKTNSQGKFITGGVKYEGDFVNGAANGFGNFYDESGKIVYAGEFKDGEILTTSPQVEYIDKTKSAQTSSLESAEKMYNAIIYENKNLESFLKLLAKSGLNNRSTNGSKTPSSSSNQSGQCYDCKGTGRCNKCNVTSKKQYYVGKGRYEWRNESRPGLIQCGTCFGRGHQQRSTVGGWEPSGDCYVSQCQDGWVPCSQCNSGGNGKNIGQCVTCKGSGKRKTY